MRRQWEDEAALRQLFAPAPLRVVWSGCPLPDLSDHRQLIGDPVSFSTERLDELAGAFRDLPNGRLVVTGPPGSGKSTFALLLTLALLRDRTAEAPTPVLLSLASYDPRRDRFGDWLRHRLTTDHPVLADTETYGPTVVEDLMADRRLLPLLDGLDELPPALQGAVLSAVNRTFPVDAPLVLICRTAQYTAAVERAGVLPGAAVIEPAQVSPADAVALLRLAAPPGRGGERRTAWADHLEGHPEGPAAQALASPLVVALARMTYADGGHDPAELTDTARFATGAAIERHLLTLFVPALYTRAVERRPAGRRAWDPVRAERHLSQLARGMRRENTYDWTWWNVYRWSPLLAGPWWSCSTSASRQVTEATT
ncbi:NACHT domain-containing protein [Streptomyces sp. NPDC059002]|uniref:NACHT domain-containing protein n=1 Tax=Streptomyces sp. NPDC059002 TaxID=3346690 RepID=UPI00368BB17D